MSAIRIKPLLLIFIFGLLLGCEGKLRPNKQLRLSPDDIITEDELRASEVDPDNKETPEERPEVKDGDPIIVGGDQTVVTTPDAEAEAARLAAEQAARAQAEKDRLAAEEAARAQAEKDRLAAEEAAREAAARAQAERDRLAAEEAARLAAEAAAREAARNRPDLDDGNPEDKDVTGRDDGSGVFTDQPAGTITADTITDDFLGQASPGDERNTVPLAGADGFINQTDLPKLMAEDAFYEEYYKQNPQVFERYKVILTRKDAHFERLNSVDGLIRNLEPNELTRVQEYSVCQVAEGMEQPLTTHLPLSFEEFEQKDRAQQDFSLGMQTVLRQKQQGEGDLGMGYLRLTPDQDPWTNENSSYPDPHDQVAAIPYSGADLFFNLNEYLTRVFNKAATKADSTYNCLDGKGEGQEVCAGKDEERKRLLQYYMTMRILRAISQGNMSECSEIKGDAMALFMKESFDPENQSGEIDQLNLRIQQAANCAVAGTIDHERSGSISQWIGSWFNDDLEFGFMGQLTNTERKLAVESFLLQLVQEVMQIKAAGFFKPQACEPKEGEEECTETEKASPTEEFDTLLTNIQSRAQESYEAIFFRYPILRYLNELTEAENGDEDSSQVVFANDQDLLQAAGRVRTIVSRVSSEFDDASPMGADLSTLVTFPLAATKIIETAPVEARGNYCTALNRALSKNERGSWNPRNLWAYMNTLERCSSGTVQDSMVCNADQLFHDKEISESTAWIYSGALGLLALWISNSIRKGLFSPKPFKPIHPYYTDPTNPNGLSCQGNFGHDFVNGAPRSETNNAPINQKHVDWYRNHPTYKRIHKSHKHLKNATEAEQAAAARRILGVKDGATFQEIRLAYLKINGQFLNPKFIGARKSIHRWITRERAKPLSKNIDLTPSEAMKAVKDSYRILSPKAPRAPSRMGQTVSGWGKSLRDAWTKFRNRNQPAAPPAQITGPQGKPH